MFRNWRLFIACSALIYPGLALAQGHQPTSELRFEPNAPMPGQEVSVSIRTVGPTAERLVLRGRLRTPRHDNYNRWMTQTAVTELHQMEDGTYLGKFVLPDDVVFGAFAIETPTGDWADDNGGRPWELVVHDSSGRPLFDALVQRLNDYMGRDVREVIASARLATKLYPDVPLAWALLGTAQGWNAAAATPEDREEWQRTVVAVVTRVSQRTDLSPADMADLVWLTWGTATAAEWRERLDRDHPNHPWLIVQRMREGQRDHRGDSEALLAVYEETWNSLVSLGEPANVREEEHRLSLASMALRLALDAGRPETPGAGQRAEELTARQATWLARMRSAASPERQLAVLLREPRLIDHALPVALQEVERLEALRPEDRELGQTLEHQRRTHRHRVARVKGAMAEALLAAGRPSEALAVARQAVELLPSPGTLRALGEAQFVLGDSATALSIWATISVHPTTSAAFADTVRERLGISFKQERWEADRATAWEDLLRTTRGEAVERALPDLVLATSAGHRQTLASLLRDAEGAVAVFVSRTCAGSMHALPRLQELAHELAEQGVVVVTITKDAIEPGYLEPFRSAGFELPIYHDITGAASPAFNTWVTPDYFVLDRNGNVRFEHGDLTLIAVQLAALRGS
jgi:hypothetical protein